MTGPDPLLIAGTVHCATEDCGAVAFPIDAVWVGRQILVSFPAACAHTNAMIWLVAPGQDEEEDDTCGAATRSGRACRRRTGGTFCHQHHPRISGRRC